MKLLVGLGNPGRKHVLNRHNLGFLAVEAWVLLKGEEFRKEEFQSQTAKVKVGGEDVLVMKPLTYMNRSGEAVGEAMRFYKIGVADLIVVHDELDIPPMSFRLKKGGGHAGHNGLRSIDSVEGQNYLRRMLIRFGNSIKLVDMTDAAYFYTKDKITFLVSRSTGKRYPVDCPLDKLENMLDAKTFFRINRQFIVNVTAIREMQPYSKSRVKVELEPATDLETIVSTERSSDFKKWLVGEQV